MCSHDGVSLHSHINQLARPCLISLEECSRALVHLGEEEHTGHGEVLHYPPDQHNQVCGVADEVLHCWLVRSSSRNDEDGEEEDSKKPMKWMRLIQFLLLSTNYKGGRQRDCMPDNWSAPTNIYMGDQPAWTGMSRDRVQAAGAVHHQLRGGEAGGQDGAHRGQHHQLGGESWEVQPQEGEGGVNLCASAWG